MIFAIVLWYVVHILSCILDRECNDKTNEGFYSIKNIRSLKTWLCLDPISIINKIADVKQVICKQTITMLISSLLVSS